MASPFHYHSVAILSPYMTVVFDHKQQWWMKITLFKRSYQLLQDQDYPLRRYDIVQSKACGGILSLEQDSSAPPVCFFSQPNKFACCAGVEIQPFLLRTMYISRAIGRVASNAFRAPAARIANKSFTAPVAVKGTSKSSPMNAIFESQCT